MGKLNNPGSKGTVSCGYRVKTSTLIEIESFEQVCVIANKLPR